jgi:glutamyl-tRNA reductase
MKIILWGVNHKTAPVEVRERLAIATEQLAEVTRQLLETPGMRECLVLSTCNRVEFVTSHDERDGVIPDVLRFLERHFNIDAASLQPHLYEYREREAVQHLFRVASSLDSMVVGEPQILGQVKESYAVAKSVGAVQASLDKLLRMALVVAKKVRTETQIGSSSVSIASTAVDLAKRIYGSLEGRQVLLVGAGKMSELAARHLMQHGTSPILVANRTQARAELLAQKYGGQSIPFEDLQDHAHLADIIITSTGSAQPIFRPEHVRKMLQKRKNQPIFFVDIAVPRDVDPLVNRLESVFLYDIDDLQSVAASHMATRSREADKAERIVIEEVDRYLQGLRTLDVVPAIVEIQKTFEKTRQTETRRMQAKLQSLSPEQRTAVEALTRGLMNKYLHQTVHAMKAAAREGDAATVKAIRDIFAASDASEEAIAMPSAAEEDVEAGFEEPAERGLLLPSTEELYVAAGPINLVKKGRD